MGTKSAKKVDFKRLAAALDDYRFAYLVTVDDDYRVHTVTVEPELREQVLDLPAGEPARTSKAAATSHCCGRQVSRVAIRSSSMAGPKSPMRRTPMTTALRFG
jgi:hypothetical protein